MPEIDKRTQAAPRRFENYIFTKVVDSSAGLTNIRDDQFTQVPDKPGLGGANGSVVFNGYSYNLDPLPIGFLFNFDGVVYDHFVASINGWLVLADPALQGGFSPGEVLTGTFHEGEGSTGSESDNTTIRPTFTSQAALICPWFDELRNCSQHASQISNYPLWNYSGAQLTTKNSRLNAGLEPPPEFFNGVSYGVSYFNDVRSRKGRRLIVRWSSVSNAIAPQGAVIKFEAVIYENGTIEFRYAPKSNLPDAPPAYWNEDATVGIFMPNGTDRFRDFSPGLAAPDIVPGTQEYIYGGYTTQYSTQLTPRLNWPGLHTAGCVMTFSPPVSRRKVLPRKALGTSESAMTLPLVARTGDSRRGLAFSSFDDRKSPNFTNSTDISPVLVNYPSTLPRFFGGDGPGTLERQDLFSGDFLVTGSVVKSAIDQFANEQPTTSVDAFNESALFDQSSASLTDLFFTSGSNPNYVESGFNQGLRSKTQIKVSLPVNFNITMPGTTSSIYYYNKKTKSWNVPINSAYVQPTGSAQPPLFISGKPAGGDWCDPRTWTTGSLPLVPEDARGFGPIGNIVSSGSLRLAQAGTGGASQTDSAIGKNYVSNGNPSFADVIGKSYGKSIRNNEEYRPTNDETFTLPINSPLLVEKAMFEIPFAAGAGWFDSYTQAVLPFGGSMEFGPNPDFAGPALTVALHRHVTLSKNQLSGSSVSYRELIMTGTIIPSTDNFHSVSILQTPDRKVPVPASVIYQVKADGFLAYANPAGCVITPGANNSFSGSAIVRSEALNTTGVVTNYFEGLTTGAGLSKAQKLARIRALITTDQSLLIGGTYAITTKRNRYQSVAPIGRAGTGRPSGRAILGNDAVTFQGLTDQTGKTVKSPFYLGASGISTANEAILTYLNTLSNFNATAVTALPLMCHFPSPFLVMPGDKLVLSISKMRPPCIAGPDLFAVGPFPSFTSSLGSVSHDVSLISGTINITLFGSQVKEAVEFHDTLNQSLGSNVVHEIIGAEPVLDQFDVSYSQEMSSSTFSRFTLEKSVQYLYLDRSSYAPFHGVSTLISSSAETTKIYDAFSDNDRHNLTSWSTQLNWTSARRISEIKGYPRNSIFQSENETYWDTRVPEPTNMLAVQSPGFVLAAGSSGPGLITDLVLFTGREYANYVDYSGPTPPASSSRGCGDWIMSFPYEPRWSSIQNVFSDKIKGGNYLYKLSGFSGGPFGPRPTFFADIVIEFGRRNDALAAIRNTAAEHSDLAGGVAGGLGLSEFVKFFYGFGDGRNSADNCHVTFRQYDAFTGFWSCAELRGWRYGLYSGFPMRTNAVFRRNRFGQMRDMLEQRPDTKFFQDVLVTSPSLVVSGSTIQTRLLSRRPTQSTARQSLAQAGPVFVKFVDSSGSPTTPSFTMSSNLSFEATSSLPYFDGVVRNREEPLSLSLTNKNTVVI